MPLLAWRLLLSSHRGQVEADFELAFSAFDPGADPGVGGVGLFSGTHVLAVEAGAPLLRGRAARLRIPGRPVPSSSAAGPARQPRAALRSTAAASAVRPAGPRRSASRSSAARAARRFVGFFACRDRARRPVGRRPSSPWSCPGPARHFLRPTRPSPLLSRLEPVLVFSSASARTPAPAFAAPRPESRALEPSAALRSPSLLRTAPARIREIPEPSRSSRVPADPAPLRFHQVSSAPSFEPRQADHRLDAGVVFDLGAGTPSSPAGAAEEVTGCPCR